MKRASSIAALSALALSGCMSQATLNTWDDDRLCAWVHVQGESAMKVALERQLISPRHADDVRKGTVAVGFSQCELLAARGLPSDVYRSAGGFKAYHYRTDYSVKTFYLRGGEVVDWNSIN